MQDLNSRIAHFYNATSRMWLNLWGEHMHQGFYGANGELKKEHVKAQSDMIDELLAWATVKSASHILDAGAGVGGSARYLSKKFNAKVKGYTLSSVQADEAKILNAQDGLLNSVDISVADMMQAMDGTEKYDFIWSLESAEHIEHKENLIKLFYDQLESGGKLIIATWCSVKPHGSLNAKERSILNKIHKHYQLPPMISIQDYEVIANRIGFKQIQIADWSKSVMPFWFAVIKEAVKWKSIMALLKAGMPAIRGAFTVRQMQKAYKLGIIQFGVLHAMKL